MRAGAAAGLKPVEIYELTPYEVLRHAAFVMEHEIESRQRLAHLVGSLAGFSKIPPYEQVFPDPEIEALENEPMDAAEAFALLGFKV